MDIILLIIGFFINLANGFQDLGNSRSEIWLAREIKMSEDEYSRILIKEEERKRNSKIWHRWGFLTYGLMGLVFGATQFEKGIIYAIYFTLVFWFLRPVVFNPVIGIGLIENGGFFHLSGTKGSWDNFFKKTIGEKAYWFGCLAILITIIVLYFLEIELW